MDLQNYITQNKMAYQRLLRCYYPDIFKRIKSIPYGKSFAEKTYLYIHNTSPHICECGCNLRFINVFEGYTQQCNACYKKKRKENSTLSTVLSSQPSTAPVCENISCENLVTKKRNGIWSKYCSTTCRGQHNSSKSRSKAKETWQEKYGVDHHRQDPENLKKFIDTINERYGVTNLMYNPNFKDQVRKTNLERYGAECSLQSDTVKEKIRQTNLKRYGVPNPSQNSNVHSKKINTLYSKKEYVLPTKEIVNLQGYEPEIVNRLIQDSRNISFNVESIPYEFEGKTHYYIPDFIVDDKIGEVKSFYTFWADRDKNLKKFLSVPNDIVIFILDDKQKECFSFVIDHNWRELYNNGNYDIFQNDSNGQLCDFKCKDSGTTIKYNHVRYCTETIAGSTRHNSRYSNNTIIIESSLYETRKFQYLNLLSYRCQHFGAEKVYARKTSIIEVTKKQAREFCENNHIQGYTNSVYYGLVHKNQLIAVAGFSKSRAGIGKQRENTWELTRYCTNKHVVGGCGKLVKYFSDLYDCNIISYSDNTISSGNMYHKIGFELSHEVVPRYRYISADSDELLHRFRFAKKKLKSMPNYSNDLSESDIMKLNKYFRVYEAGKRTWIWNK